MTSPQFADQLKALREMATKGPLEVSHDYRPGMAWNNHIVRVGSPHTICFMAHEPKGNDGQEAIAELFVLLANHSEAIEKVVRHSDALMKLLKHSVDVGPHDNPRTEAHHCRALRAALNELEGKG